MFFFSSRRRHTRCLSDWSSDVCSSDLTRQRQHVRKKPRAEQHVGLNVLRLAVRLGLGEEARKAVENLQEGRNGSVIKRHAVLFRLMRIFGWWEYVA